MHSTKQDVLLSKIFEQDSLVCSKIHNRRVPSLLDSVSNVVLPALCMWCWGCCSCGSLKLLTHLLQAVKVFRCTTRVVVEMRTA